MLSCSRRARPYFVCFVSASVMFALHDRKCLLAKQTNKQTKKKEKKKSSAPYRSLRLMRKQLIVPLTVQRFSQINHCDFSVAVHCGDGRKQADFRQSTESDSEKLKASLEG
ncbi:hypothetical protein XENORESO_004783 [Xenotaenia resolanae]|uniref:Secreted protein n=1 Tax=Xenotaenia resolanae TaxID=208358 RepID=A0ABV0W9W8_9TELE